MGNKTYKELVFKTRSEASEAINWLCYTIEQAGVKRTPQPDALRGMYVQSIDEPLPYLFGDFDGRGTWVRAYYEREE
ncbi:MAG: hypothetical protein KBS70_08270 [Bacteroidales bacterium]|nr:hypothetical protein [Candidatus Colicola equi]